VPFGHPAEFSPIQHPGRGERTPERDLALSSSQQAVLYHRAVNQIAVLYEVQAVPRPGHGSDAGGDISRGRSFVKSWLMSVRLCQMIAAWTSDDNDCRNLVKAFLSVIITSGQPLQNITDVSEEASTEIGDGMRGTRGCGVRSDIVRRLWLGVDLDRAMRPGLRGVGER
jgi:hypothetical protein